MMKRIFKYQLKRTDYQRLHLPIGSKILSVVQQNDNLVLYALVDDDVSIKRPYGVYILITGHSACDVSDATFLGTVKLLDVAHVFIKQGALC